MKQYVIIGNGVAAAGCIEGIRSVDPTNPIMVVSQEDRAVYCRPLISYYLEGKTDLDRMQYTLHNPHSRICPTPVDNTLSSDNSPQSPHRKRILCI